MEGILGSLFWLFFCFGLLLCISGWGVLKNDGVDYIMNQNVVIKRMLLDSQLGMAAELSLGSTRVLMSRAQWRAWLGSIYLFELSQTWIHSLWARLGSARLGYKFELEAKLKAVGLRPSSLSLFFFFFFFFEPNSSFIFFTKESPTAPINQLFFLNFYRPVRIWLGLPKPNSPAKPQQNKQKRSQRFSKEPKRTLS